MKNKLMKYGLMLVAAVLILGSVFAGAVSAEDQYVEVSGWTELNTTVSEWTSATDRLTVAVIDDITDREAGEDGNGIIVSGLVTVTVVDNGDDESLIDGKRHGRIFLVEDTGNLTLCGNGRSVLNLTGGYVDDSGSGGAVFVQGGFLSVSAGVKITYCEAEMYGGAVHIEPGTFVMNGGAISNCEAYYGGGVSVINSESTFIMNDFSSIAYCNATQTGGGVYNVGSFDMTESSSITFCNASESGGGVENVLSFNMTDSSSISYCCAGNLGGGVGMGGGSDNIFNLSGGSITFCNATNGGGVGIPNYCTLNMSGGSISECEATDSGGGVYIFSGIFNVKGSPTITGNTVGDNTHNVYYKYSEFYLVGDFTGKISIYYGNGECRENNRFGEYISGSGAENFVADNTNDMLCGIIRYSTPFNSLMWTLTYVEVSGWTELNTTVSDWTSPTKARTVVIHQDITDREQNENQNGIDVFGNVVIIPNSSTSDEDVLIDGKNYGRLFNVSDGGNLTLCGNTTEGTTILNLTNGDIAGDGGAMYVNNGGSLTLSAYAEITNSDAEYGGGVYVGPHGKFIMNRGSISDCYGGNDGGGVFVDNQGTFEMFDSRITDCNAVFIGGGVYGYKSTINMTNGSSISYCNATDSGSNAGGGAVFIKNSIFTMDGSSISCCNATGSNSDNGGGAVYLYNSTIDMINGSLISDCSAYWYGGGIYSASTNGFVNISDSSIDGCNACYGGGVYVEKGTLNLHDGSITGCTAEQGGGVNIKNDYLNIYGDSSIEDCNAVEGGAVFAGISATVMMYDGSIKDCKADNDGGGLYSFGPFAMYGGNIVGCEAECGGGVYQYDDAFTMYGGSIKDCSAECGGGLYNVFIFRIVDGKITECEATECGGGVYSTGVVEVNSSARITDNTVGGSKNNLYLENMDNLNLVGDFNGKIGIAFAGNVPEDELIFGIYTDGYGASRFVADNDQTLVGSVDGTDLVWTHIKQSSSGQTGYTTILTDPVTPTRTPADVPTNVPISKPTTQQTQASPAPFVGLVIGLGATAVLLRLRK